MTEPVTLADLPGIDADAVDHEQPNPQGLGPASCSRSPETDELRSLYENHENRTNVGEIWSLCESLEQERNELDTACSLYKFQNDAARDVLDAISSALEEATGKILPLSELVGEIIHQREAAIVALQKIADIYLEETDDIWADMDAIHAIAHNALYHPENDTAHATAPETP